MLSTILVAIDGSKLSLEAAEWGLKMFADERLDVQKVIVCCVGIKSTQFTSVVDASTCKSQILF